MGKQHSVQHSQRVDCKMKVRLQYSIFLYKKLCFLTDAPQWNSKMKDSFYNFGYFFFRKSGFFFLTVLQQWNSKMMVRLRTLLNIFKEVFFL